MIGSKQSLNVSATAPTRRVPSPQILWPTAVSYGDNVTSGDDSVRFPGLTAIKARKSAAEVSMLNAFLKAAGDAQDRIWIIDDYLFKTREGKPLQIRIDQVLSMFPLSLVANDVKILTNAVENEMDNIKAQLSGLADDINALSKYRKGTATFEVRFTLGTDFPHIHDRFAVVDDELWHFGATVGGLHDLVNAASRGWRIQDHGALEFFELAWNGDTDHKGYK